MSSLYFHIIPYLYFFSLQIRETHSEYNFPWSKAEACNCDRLTPISLDSSRAKPVRVSEMVINISRDAEFEFNNDGGLVRGNIIRGTGILTGGPLLNDTYQLIRTLHLVDGVSKFTRTSGLRDGRGTPVTHEVVFQKTGLTLDEAFESPDGFVIIAFPINVEGNRDNPRFKPYARILQAVTEVNATTSSLAEDCLPWLLEYLQHNCYFSFPGSRVRPPVVNLFPVSIWIVPSSKIQITLSYRQYNEYLKVMNSAGQPLLNPAPCYQQGNRTVIEVCDPVKIKFGKS